MASRCQYRTGIETLHTPYEKSIVERVNQYFKDRIEGFDDYYPCTGKRNCDLDHNYNWLSFYVSMYNDIKTHRFRIKLRGENIILS